MVAALQSPHAESSAGAMECSLGAVGCLADGNQANQARLGACGACTGRSLDESPSLSVELPAKTLSVKLSCFDFALFVLSVIGFLNCLSCLARPQR